MTRPSTHPSVASQETHRWSQLQKWTHPTPEAADAGTGFVSGLPLELMASALRKPSILSRLFSALCLQSQSIGCHFRYTILIRAAHKGSETSPSEKEILVDHPSAPTPNENAEILINYLPPSLLSEQSEILTSKR